MPPMAYANVCLGWMKTPSASTVTPSSSANWPTENVFLDALDASLHTQRSPQRCPTSVTQDERAGVGGPAGLMGGRTEHMVEDQGAHAAVNIARRPLVGRTGNEFRPHQSVGIVMHDQRGRHGVAHTDHRVAPCHGLAVWRPLHAQRTRPQRAAQFVRGAVDLGDRSRHRRFGFRADADVDEPADRLGQRRVERLEPADVDAGRLFVHARNLTGPR